MLRLKHVSLWSIMTEQNFSNLQHSGVTLENKVECQISPQTLCGGVGMFQIEKTSPFLPCTPLLAVWLAVLQYLRPCGHLPAALLARRTPFRALHLTALTSHGTHPSKAKFSPQALSRPVLSHSPHAECLRKLQKEKNKPPIELFAIGDLNGLDINPTRTSSSNRLPWMLDSIQLKSFHEIN